MTRVRTTRCWRPALAVFVVTPAASPVWAQDEFRKELLANGGYALSEGIPVHEGQLEGVGVDNEYAHQLDLSGGVNFRF